METLQPHPNIYLAVDRHLYCKCDTNMTCNNTEIQNEVRHSDNAAEIGMVTGILLALVFNLMLTYKYDKFNVIKQSLCCTDLICAKTVSTMSIIIIILVIFISMPLLILFSVIAFAYKLICTQLIKQKDKKYAGLLDSFDVFWSLEDETSRSIINVVGIIESQSSAFLVSCIVEKLETVYTENKWMEKIFHLRSQKYGFYYWRRNNNVDLDEYIKIVNYNYGKEQNDGYLEDLMSEYSEKPLPYRNGGLFQILVTACPIKQETNAKQAYGIIFKVHHSLGDGIALIELLCQNLADDKGSSLELFRAKNFLKNEKENTPRKFIDKINTLIQMPVCFAKGIIRVPDENALHGPVLTGNKIFTWTHCDENLLPMIKEVKRNVFGVKCIDLLTVALSEALKFFFMQRTTSLPEEVAVILPIRFPKRSDDECLKLENNFSVTILDVPIVNTRNCDSKLNVIRRRYEELRTSADPVMNYYFLKFAGAILPNQILKPMLTSRQATLVLSNIPGPDLLTICGGNTLKQLVFFVPNKGNTGLGVTAMSYGGVLRLAAAADRALVSNSAELKVILDGMVAEIRRLHRLHSLQ